MDIIEKLGITPGPWEVNGYTEDDIDLEVYASPMRFVEKYKAIQADWICDLCVDNTSGGFEAVEANAHLISAAPEMLKALITNVKNEKGIDCDYEISIIEKATGKTWEEIKELIND